MKISRKRKIYNMNLMLVPLPQEGQRARMIERYSREPMARIWTEQARYEAWWKVELAVVEARAERGEIPAAAVEQIRRDARFTIPRNSRGRGGSSA